MKYTKSCPACREMKKLGLTFEETHSSYRPGYLVVNDKEIPSPHGAATYNENCKALVNWAVSDGRLVFNGAEISYSTFKEFARKRNVAIYHLEVNTETRFTGLTDPGAPRTEGGGGLFDFPDRLRNRLISQQKRGDNRFKIYQVAGKGSRWMIRFK